MNAIMVHRTSEDRLDAIMAEGLSTDMPTALTDCGHWAQAWYGMNPVFLALPDAPFLAAQPEGGVLLAVDVSRLPLVADLPSLCDAGGRFDEGYLVWRRGHEREELRPFLDAYGSIEIEHLLDPTTDACCAAINVTRTAAALEPIPVDCLSLAPSWRSTAVP
jgi:hypothetical protein